MQWGFVLYVRQWYSPWRSHSQLSAFDRQFRNV
jgi:hypothetical protein